MRISTTAIEQGFILADATLSPEPCWFEPAHWQSAGEGKLLGRGRGMAFSAGSDGQWVLRHYHRGGLPGRLVNDRYVWLGEALSRPVREFRVLAELADAGAPVPRPVAARVQRSGPFYTGDILVERVPDAATLAELAPGLNVARWAETGRAIRRFHQAGGWHADLNANNVLVTPDRVVIIDLDRGRSRCANSGRQRANLSRLLRSLSKLQLMPAAAKGWRALLEGYEAAGSA